MMLGWSRENLVFVLKGVCAFSLCTTLSFSVEAQSKDSKSNDDEAAMEFEELIFETSKKKRNVKANVSKVQRPVEAPKKEATSTQTENASVSSPKIEEESQFVVEDGGEPEPVLVDDVPTKELSNEALTFTPFGYMRMGFRMIQDDPGVAFVGRTDGFFLQNARFGVEAEYQHVRLRISADGARDHREGPNELEGRLQAALMDAFADLKVMKGLQLRFGHFRAQYDLESVLYPNQRMFVTRSVSSNGVAPTQGFEIEGLSIPRDIGLAVRYEHQKDDSFHVATELALQNGNTALASSNDGQGIAVTGSVFVESKGLFARAALRYNPRVRGELPFRQNENDLGGMVSLGVDKQGFNAMGQVLARRRTFETLTGIDENALGFLLRVVAPLPRLDWAKLGYRYSYLQPSDRVVADTVQEHSFGATALLEKFNARVFVQGTLVMEEAAKTLDNHRLEALLEVRL